MRAGPADDRTLSLVHAAGYVDAVRRAPVPGFSFSVGHGLGTSDDRIFPGMRERAALIAGGRRSRRGRSRTVRSTGR